MTEALIAISDELALVAAKNAFPSEVAPGGLAGWGSLKVKKPAGQWDGNVKVDFAELLANAGRRATGRHMWEEEGAIGWAVGSLTLNHSAMVLAKCDVPFRIDGGLVHYAADVYDENRALTALHLKAGEHHVALMFSNGGFKCSMYEMRFGRSGAQMRKNMTSVEDGSNGRSPLLLLKDAQMADVVDGVLASHYLSVPVMNLMAEPIIIKEAHLVDAPPGLELRPVAALAHLAPGQQQPLRLELNGPPLAPSPPAFECARGQTFRLQVRLVPARARDGRGLPAQIRNLTSKCAGSFEGNGGYVITYPDFDGSIQRAWVSPPNVENAPGWRCPPGGCPVLLSLHGADVTVDGLGMRTFSYKENGSFPYAAWLVMPTNRWHWGTDWEGQGFDNGLAALRFVCAHLPGTGHVLNAAEAAEDGAGKALLSRYMPNPTRVVLHGHSMGGHGCYVMGTHFPDGLMGMACAAGWTSMGAEQSRLLDTSRSGLWQEDFSEHAADQLAGNLYGVPLLITYGDKDDNVPPTESRYMARLVSSLGGGASEALWEERETGHWFSQKTPALDAFFRNLLHGEGHPSEAPHRATQNAVMAELITMARSTREMATKADAAARNAQRMADAAMSSVSSQVHAHGASSTASDSAFGASFSERPRIFDAALLRREGARRFERASTLLENVPAKKLLVAAAGADADGKTSGLEHRSREADQSSLSEAPARSQRERVAAELASRPSVPSALPRELPPLPDNFEFEVTNTATFGTRGNLQVLQLEAPHTPAKLLVSRRPTPSRSGGGSGAVQEIPFASSAGEIWILRTYNARRLRLRYPPMPGVPVPKVLYIDGVRFSGASLGGDGAPAGRHFCRPSSSDANANASRWSVCDDSSWVNLERGSPVQGGPVHMALRRAPVCIVHYGATHNSERHAVALANRMYFVSRYMPTVLDGSSLAPEDSEAARKCSSDSNLILLGHADQNTWGRRLACSVRYVQQLAGGAFAIGGEHYSAPGTAVVALGANTKTGRRVLLVAGTDEEGLARATLAVPVSSGQPGADFAVFGPRSSWAGQGGLRAAGYVDHQWRVLPRTSGLAFVEPEPPSWVSTPSDNATIASSLAACGAEETALARAGEELLRVQAGGATAEVATSHAVTSSAPTKVRPAWGS
eukprot:TRINITY_DN18510_c0_g2_i1.p1 TRINITY_DN18510_c0_g2~~TRINITY_DN18510_c0_g2_i1.p1  ORF type:complete len:1146 (+),score=232.68 TRINITY_DN18510_c0_g2_i1:102-3539(+)